MYGWHESIVVSFLFCLVVFFLRFHPYVYLFSFRKRIVTHSNILGLGTERRTPGVEHQAKRDAPNTSGRLASFSSEGQESRALLRSSWCVHHVGSPHSTVTDTLTI